MPLSSTLPGRTHRDRRKADPTDRYRAQVLAAFPGHVERIVLFGSRVRDELHEDSDWDFAVYLDHEPDQEEERRLRAISLALSNQTGEEVQSFLFAPERWRATDELACNIREEGAIIDGDHSKPMIERPVLQHARVALEKAGRFAHLSEQVPDASFEGVIHGACYAMFHAARAALLAVQGTASTQHGRAVASSARMVERRNLGPEASGLAQTLSEGLQAARGCRLQQRRSHPGGAGVTCADAAVPGAVRQTRGAACRGVVRVPSDVGAGALRPRIEKRGRAAD